MARSQVVVGLGDCAGLGHVTEFLRHVCVAALLGVVDEVHAVVSCCDLAILDNLARKDVAVSGFHLVLLAHDLPELGLGNDVVWRKDFEAEHSRVVVRRSGLLASHDLVVLQEGADHFFFLNEKTKQCNHLSRTMFTVADEG